MFRSGFIIALITAFVCIGCQGTIDRRDAAEVDLTKICKELPLPPRLVSLRSRTTRDLSKVAIFRDMVTDSECADIGDHFTKYFISKDWDKSRMKTALEGGGMKSMEYSYRDNEYLVSVECEAEPRDPQVRKLEISCSWGLMNE